MSKEKLSNFLPRITYKGKKINQQIEPAQAASDITYKYRGETQHLKLHEDFDHYTEFESKLFKNIFKILKNLEVRALQATDIGFVKLF